MNDCLFCKIVNKEIKVDIEYEDSDILAFFDIDPKAPIHILIIPKKHIPSLNELTEGDQLIAGKILIVAKKLAKKYNLDKSGYRVVTNTGRDAGQTVNHLHFHLLGGKELGTLA